MSAFSLRRLLIDVFEPEPGERVTVMTDLPHGSLADHPDWAERRLMAAEWQQAFAALGQERGFEVHPLLTYPATGAHNADLPSEGFLGQERVSLEEILSRTTLAVALTEFSPTAPLALRAARQPDFRAATLPGVLRRMEQTALAADYRRIAARCRWIRERLEPAEEMEVLFATGHLWRVDLRYRRVEVDDGHLPRHKPPPLRVINLPSGETYQVPYEGERPGEPSRTQGQIPVVAGEEVMVFQVEENCIVEVQGQGSAAEAYRALFEADPARRNIAEVAFGCNEKAVVTGNILEDEKAGFHWAFGRSDHLGGVVGVEAFRSPQTVLHQDIVYAPGSPVGVAQVLLRMADGNTLEILRDGRLLLPPELAF